MLFVHRGWYTIQHGANLLRHAFPTSLSHRVIFIQTALHSLARSLPLSLFFRIPALAPGLSHFNWILFSLFAFSLACDLFLYKSILPLKTSSNFSLHWIPNSVQESLEPSRGMEESSLEGVDKTTTETCCLFIFWLFLSLLKWGFKI